MEHLFESWYQSERWVEDGGENFKELLLERGAAFGKRIIQQKTTAARFLGINRKNKVFDKW